MVIDAFANKLEYRGRLVASSGPVQPLTAGAYLQPRSALSEWLHEEGHTYGTRRFKLFTFSRLFGKRQTQNGRITFGGSAHFYLSAVDAEVLGSFAEHLLTKPAVRLGSAGCRVRRLGSSPNRR